MPPYCLLPPPGDCLLHGYRQAQRASDIAEEAFGVEELLAKILEELQLPDLLKAKLISKRFKATVEYSPEIQRTLFRRHFNTDNPTPTMNPYFSRTAAGILAQWHSASHPLQYPPLVGSRYAFILRSVNPRLMGARFSMHMRMEDWGEQRCREWRKLYPNGLEDTLLSTHAILGDWAIAVADDDWDFLVFRKRIYGNRIEARTRQMKRYRALNSDVIGEVPINGTIGELMGWLEKHIETEKAKFATSQSERFVRMLFVVGWSAAVWVSFGGSAQG